MSGSCVTWAILGCGVFARKRLLPAFAKVSHAKLLALQRRNLAEAQATAREAGVPRAYATREELLADADIQAVFIATPNNLHLEDVRAAVAAGKHVLVEKPMGVSASECQRMIVAAQAAGVKLFVGHCFRYTHAVEQSRALLLSGQLGALRGVRCWYGFLIPATAWRKDSRISGGGPLLDLGPHALDFFRYVTGAEFAEAAAFVSPDSDPATGQCEEEARALLKFRSGATAVLELSFREHFRNGFEITGACGSLRGDFTLNQIVNENVRLLRLTSDPTPPRTEEIPLQHREVYGAQIDDVSRALLDPAHRPMCATGADGLATLQAIEAIYLAGRTGQRARVM